MDIRLADAPPTTAEREAVDGVLGTPLSAWEGGARRGRRPLRARRALRALAAPSAPARAPRGAEPRRVDQPRRRSVRVPQAHDPAGRGIRGGELLRPLRTRATPAARHPRLHRHRLHVPRRHRARRGARTHRRPGGRAPGNGTSIWLESPCLGMCERAPAALVTRAGEDATNMRSLRPRAADIVAALAGAESPGRRRALVPQAASRPPAPAQDRQRRPGEPRQLPRRRRLRRAPPGASRWARPVSSAR